MPVKSVISPIAPMKTPMRNVIRSPFASGAFMGESSSNTTWSVFWRSSPPCLASIFHTIRKPSAHSARPAKNRMPNGPRSSNAAHA